MRRRSPARACVLAAVLLALPCAAARQDGPPPRPEPVEKPAEEPAEKPVAKPVEKPVGPPAESPGVPPADAAGVTPAEKPAEKPAEAPPGVPPAPAADGAAAHPVQPAGGEAPQAAAGRLVPVPGALAQPHGPPAPSAEPEELEEVPALPLVVPEAAAQPRLVAGSAPPPVLPPYAPTYRSLQGSAELLDAMARAAPRLASTFEVGRERDGRPVLALQFGALGAVALDRRPTVVLVGGLDGVSLAGSEAVLACAHHLLSDPARLPPGVTFLAIPWAAPQALDAAAAGRSFDGRNLRPVDDDLDGRVDEDGPDDLDGNGQLLAMLVRDAAGPWTRSADPRFLERAAASGERFVLAPEGADDDGDGRYNEDPPGGVVLDRNFPVHRPADWRDALAGPLPMSEPLARAYADLVLARRTVAVVLLQGNHGLLAAPGGVPPPRGLGLPLEGDLPVYRALTERFARLCGREQADVVSLASARGAAVPGAALDWIYSVPGALCFELAPWGPNVELAGEVVARDARFGAAPPPPRLPTQEGALAPWRPRPPEARREWAAWVDNALGGLGFVAWQPVQLAGGAEALVGGWEPLTIQNPPPRSLAEALRGVPQLVEELARGLPRLEVVDVASSTQGELHRVAARVRNGGELPTGLDRSRAQGDGSGVALELALPPGALLIAGEPRVELGRIEGGARSREVAWLVLAPRGAQLTLTASCAWTLPATAKVGL